MPEPTDTTAPLDGESKDEASSFLESLGLSKVSQSPRHAAAWPPPDGPPVVADRAPKAPALVRGGERSRGSASRAPEPVHTAA